MSLNHYYHFKSRQGTLPEISREHHSFTLRLTKNLNIINLTAIDIRANTARGNKSSYHFHYKLNSYSTGGALGKGSSFNGGLLVYVFCDSTCPIGDPLMGHGRAINQMSWDWRTHTKSHFLMSTTFMGKGT